MNFRACGNPVTWAVRGRFSAFFVRRCHSTSGKDHDLRLNHPRRWRESFTPVKAGLSRFASRRFIPRSRHRHLIPPPPTHVGRVRKLVQRDVGQQFGRGFGHHCRQRDATSNIVSDQHVYDRQQPDSVRRGSCALAVSIALAIAETSRAFSSVASASCGIAVALDRCHVVALNDGAQDLDLRL